MKKIFLIFGILLLSLVNMSCKSNQINYNPREIELSLLHKTSENLVEKNEVHYTKENKLFSGIILFTSKIANKRESEYYEYKNGKLIKSKKMSYGNFKYLLPEKKDGKYYKDNKLYTGIVKNKTMKVDYINEYKDGELVKKIERSYDTIYIECYTVDLKNTLHSERVWDFKKKVIHVKTYNSNALIQEGYLDFKFKNIGIWKIYTEDGSKLKSLENYDKYNSLLKNRTKKELNGFTLTKAIEDSEWKTILYNPVFEIEYYDSNDKEIDSSQYYKEKNNFSRKLIKYRDGQISFIYYTKNKINYRFEVYYPNGNLKIKQFLKPEGKLIKKWKGYLKEYYPNGNLKSMQTITYGKQYKGIFKKFGDSIALTSTGNNNTDDVGFHYSTSLSGPFEIYYLNGQLMIVGDNGLNSKEKVKIYDEKGNDITDVIE